MTQEHKQDIQQEQSLSAFFVQLREEWDLDIEKVSHRTDIPVERLEELDKDATNITLFEATEIAILFDRKVAELANILWNEKASPILEKLRKIESEGVVLHVCPPPLIVTLADEVSKLKALESLIEDDSTVMK